MFKFNVGRLWKIGGEVSSGKLDLWLLGWGERTDLEKHWENAGEPETLKMEHQRGSYGVGRARENNPGDTVLEGGQRRAHHRGRAGAES